MNKKYILTTINIAVKDRELKNLDIRVLLCLVSYNGRGVIKPSLKTISNDIGNRDKSISSVSNSIKRLKERGYITIKRQFQKPNIYTINEMKPVKSAIKPEAVPGDTKPEPNETETIERAEGDVTRAYIERTAYIIAEYRNELTEKDNKRSKQIYKFINSVLNDYPDKDIKRYRIAFMFLYYVLIAGQEKFIEGLPYNYFKKFFPMLYYSDFRKKVFDASQNNQTFFYKHKSNPYD
jgi:DNA-binding transcriptional ArsR family regulator